MLHTQLDVQTAAGNTPTTRGAQRHKNTRKGGAPRELLQASTSKEAGHRFQGCRQRVQQPALEPSAGGMEDFREILDLFRSGTVSTYLRKFKELMQRVKAQPGSMSKILAFGLGLVEIFDD